jgi:hypothetical protein
MQAELIIQAIDASYVQIICCGTNYFTPNLRKFYLIAQVLLESMFANSNRELSAGDRQLFYYQHSLSNLATCIAIRCSLAHDLTRL